MEHDVQFMRRRMDRLEAEAAKLMDANPGLGLVQAINWVRSRDAVQARRR